MLTTELSEILKKTEAGLLTREQAANYCMVKPEAFREWLRCGFIPPMPNPNGWTAEVLDVAIQQLRLGCQHDNPRRKHSHFIKIPRCQRIWRKLQRGDGAGHWLFYFRPTGEPLPGAWGSPEFMTELIACERRFALRQNPSTSRKLETSTSSIQPRLKKRNPRPERVTLAHQTVAEDSKVQSPPIYLTAEELSERWRGKITPETLANWRAQQIGPPFSKFGKAVLYRVDLLDKWEQKNIVLYGKSNSTPVNERDD